jgi:hypothetical protein
MIEHRAFRVRRPRAPSCAFHGNGDSGYEIALRIWAAAYQAAKFAVTAALAASPALTVCNVSAQPSGADMQQTQTFPADEFLTILKRIIGNGDLRNLDRFADVLDSTIKLEPMFIRDDRGGRRIARVYVVPETDRVPFIVKGLFRYTLSIQDSAPQLGDQPRKSGRNPRQIAAISIQAMFKVGCVTRDDLVAEFGEISSRTVATDGGGESVTFHVAKGIDYATWLSAAFETGNPCTTLLSISQTSAE